MFIINGVWYHKTPRWLTKSKNRTFKVIQNMQVEILPQGLTRNRWCAVQSGQTSSVLKRIALFTLLFNKIVWKCHTVPLDKSTACSLFSPAYTACTPPLRSAVNQVHNLKDTHCTTSIISKPTLNRGTFLLLYKIRFKKKNWKENPPTGLQGSQQKTK